MNIFLCSLAVALITIMVSVALPIWAENVLWFSFYVYFVLIIVATVGIIFDEDSSDTYKAEVSARGTFENSFITVSSYVIPLILAAHDFLFFAGVLVACSLILHGKRMEA